MPYNLDSLESFIYVERDNALGDFNERTLQVDFFFSQYEEVVCLMSKRLIFFVVVLRDICVIDRFLSK